MFSTVTSAKKKKITAIRYMLFLKRETDMSRVPHATQTVPNSTAKHENCPQRTALTHHFTAAGSCVMASLREVDARKTIYRLSSATKLNA